MLKMVEGSQKMFYSMGEVSTMLDVPHATLRYWEKMFDFIKPNKNKKGNRMFTPKDVENLKLVHHLLKERRFTIEGVQKYFRTNGAEIRKSGAILERLLLIKSQLEEIRQELNMDSEPIDTSKAVVITNDASNGLELTSEEMPNDEQSQNNIKEHHPRIMEQTLF